MLKPPDDEMPGNLKSYSTTVKYRGLHRLVRDVARQRYDCPARFCRRTATLARHLERKEQIFGTLLIISRHPAASGRNDPKSSRPSQRCSSSVVSGWVLNTAATKAETKSYAVNLQEISDPIGFFVMASVVAARNARSFCPV